MRYCSICIILVLCAAQVYAQQPTGVKAGDTPNDSGGSITVTWDYPESYEGVKQVTYTIYISESENGPFHGCQDQRG